MLAVGQALSWLGNGFQTVALAFAVVHSGGGAGELGLVMASEVIAMLVGTLFGGVWADRLQPQRVMVLSDAARCAAAIGMAVMFGIGHQSVVPLCILAGLFGAAGSFFSPAMMALKPMVVPVTQRQSGNARLSLLQTTCSVFGPAIGGVVVGVSGAPTGFAVNALSFLASVITTLLIRARVERTPRHGMMRELAEGWSEVRSRDWLFYGVLSAMVYQIANGVVLVLSTVVAVQELGGAHAVGLIAAAEGIGGVVGAGIALRLRLQRALLAGWFAILLMSLWVFSYVWPGVLVAVMAGAVMGYAGLTFFSIAWQTAMQDHIPHRLLARVVSWDMLASFVAMPIGNAMAGPLASAFGIDHVLVVCGCVIFGASLLPIFVRGTWQLTRPADQATVGHVEADAVQPLQ
jgi:MFS family permease